MHKNKQKYDKILLKGCDFMNNGICKICGKKGKLTFEHIPPRKAFNDRRAKLFTGNELSKTISDKKRLPWDLSGLKYKQQQRGVGLYSLCASCNSLTGTLYGDEYIKFAWTIGKLLNENSMEGKNTVGIKLENVYISRIAKQILSMFCSTYSGFTKKYPYVKNLILNKDEILKTFSDFRITMFLLKEYKISYTGLTALAYGNGQTKILAEIDAYPFGFVLELEPKEVSTDLDITSFLNHKYNEQFDLELGINIRERNIMFPLDFRTKEEIMETMEDNQKF